MDIKLNRQIKKKQEARNIVKEILNFGVSEDQKIEIIFNIVLSLENNDAMKDISKEVKKYLKFINNEEEDNIIENKPKIIIE